MSGNAFCIFPHARSAHRQHNVTRGQDTQKVRRLPRVLRRVALAPNPSGFDHTDRRRCARRGLGNPWQILGAPLPHQAKTSHTTARRKEIRVVNWDLAATPSEHSQSWRHPAGSSTDQMLALWRGGCLDPRDFLRSPHRNLWLSKPNCCVSALHWDSNCQRHSIPVKLLTQMCGLRPWCRNDFRRLKLASGSQTPECKSARTVHSQRSQQTAAGMPIWYCS